MRGHDVAGIAGWLTERVATYLDMDAGEIDAATPLAEYGVNSVYAVGIAGEIEDAFGLVLEPTDLWDHPTVDALARRVHDLLAAAPVGEQP